jgi:hypothetical protein
LDWETDCRNKGSKEEIVVLGCGNKVSKIVVLGFGDRNKGSKEEIVVLEPRNRSLRSQEAC